jgi:subtilisin
MTARSDDTRSASRSDRRKPAESKGNVTTASSDDMRSAPRSDRRKPARASHYMIAPAALGMTRQALVDRLNRLGDVEILRTYAERDTISPPIAVVRVSDENAAALRRSTAGAFVIEPDRYLRAASFAGTSLPFHAMAAAAMSARGPGFTVTIRAVSESGEPVEHAEVRLLGEQTATQGLTGNDGRVDLTLYGELPETVAELFVNARSGYRVLWRHRPDLQADAVNTFTLERLSLPDTLDWGGMAMRFDQLPTECRGAGIKIALIDSGVATSHKQLTSIDHGIDIRGGEERSWSQDFMSHGTPCAGLIGAIPDSAHGIRGYAPDSELHVCRLPPDARCSDLVAALDYCLQTGVDVACLGFGCERGSVIVEQRIAAAKQQGVGIIAVAGNSAGTVLFPACSPHVMAVGAIGQTGSYPEDSPQAFQAAVAAAVAGGLFVPLFSCRGPELDLCAPGVAVVACQSPDDHAVCDGTSLAAAHVTALAVLILAHHSDFKGGFAGRDFQRVERLFQILKDTAQPVGHPWQTGAGLPDAARALGVRSTRRLLTAPLDAGLGEMRSAIRQMNHIYFGAGEANAFGPPPNAFEPPRGPANVTYLPLNPTPLAFQADSGAKAGVHELKAAMMMAGLSDGR